MPLLKEISLNPNNKLAVWEMNESLEELMAMVKINDAEKESLKEIKNENRKKQKLCSKQLLKRLTGIDDLKIEYDLHGKPYLKDSKYKISISHSHQYVAVIIDTEDTGIDIEIIDPKIEKVVHKFVNTEEQQSIKAQNRLEQLYVYWCTKEALYKLYGGGSLVFKTNLLVAPFIYDNNGGTISGKIITDVYSKNCLLHYEKLANCVLVYAVNR